jgi:hypothetical protein
LIFLVKISTSNKQLIKTNLPMNDDDDDDDDNDYINTTLKTLSLCQMKYSGMCYI